MSAMIFVANSALASRSSASGRLRSAKTFPELGVNTRFAIFLLLTSGPNFERVEAGFELCPILAGELRFRMSPSSEKREGRISRPQTAPRTPRDRFRSDHPRAPARPSRQNRATFLAL